MRSAATIFAAIASMGLVSACATANGQTSSDNNAPVVVSSGSDDGERQVRVHRFVRRGGDNFEGIIENYDSNDDGKISREEYNARGNRGRFDALDADEDGFIDLAELESDLGGRMAERTERWAERMAERMERHGERMERLGERMERLGEEALADLDTNGDGEITEEDFGFSFDFDFKDFNFEFDGEKFEEHMQAQRQRALKKLDKDGNGVVSREEFAARQNKRFDELDKDDSGTLSADELDGMSIMRGFSLPSLPHIDRFGMGHRGPGRMFFWSDKDDEEDDGEAEE